MLLCVAALAAGAGCGGGGGVDQALDHLPQDTRAVGTVDLKQIRLSLGLPKNADLEQPSGDLSSSQSRLAVAAGTVIRFLSVPVDSPLRRAIDQGRIRAAAGELASSQGVTVLVTDQPLDDVAEELSGQGFQDQDGILVSDRPSRPPGARAIGGGDGLLVVGASEQVVRDALAREGGGGGPQDLLKRLDGPLRVASYVPGGNCVRGFGASDEVGIDKGELVIQPASAPDPARVRLGQGLASRRLALEDAKVRRDGDLLRLSVGRQGASGGLSPAQIAIADVLVSDIYRC